MVITPNEVEQKKIDAKIKELQDAIKVSVQAIAATAAERTRIEKKIDTLDQLQSEDEKIMKQIFSQLDAAVSGIKRTGDQADMAKTLLSMAISIGTLASLGAKSLGAAVKDFEKLNKECSRTVRTTALFS